MDMSNFLDLWDIWVNELIGSVWLFIFLGIMIISYLSIKSKLSTEVTILLNILFITIIFAKTNLIILWAFVVLGGGAFVYYINQKIIRQG